MHMLVLCVLLSCSAWASTRVYLMTCSFMILQNTWTIVA